MGAGTRRRVALVAVVLLLGGGRGDAALAGAAGTGVPPPPVGSIAPARASSGGAVAPVPGPAVRLFAPPRSAYGPGHRGVDLAAGPGEAVRAALPGRVAFAGEVAGRGWVTLDHGGGLETTYGWIDPRIVDRGDGVRRGAVIGRLAADAGHLDWGARLHGEYIDPLRLLGPWRARLVPVDP